MGRTNPSILAAFPLLARTHHNIEKRVKSDRKHACEPETWENGGDWASKFGTTRKPVLRLYEDRIGHSTARHEPCARTFSRLASAIAEPDG